MNKNIVMAILCAGLIGGSVDIASAALVNWVDPILVLRAIASGILGKASYAGGMASASLGLILQWLMSLLISSFYVIASVRYSSLNRRWIAGGLAYGLAVFFVMNYVVVMLSNAVPKTNFTPSAFALNLLAMLLYGLIIGFYTNRFASNKSSSHAGVAVAKIF